MKYDKTEYFPEYNAFQIFLHQFDSILILLEWILNGTIDKIRGCYLDA